MKNSENLVKIMNRCGITEVNNMIEKNKDSNCNNDSNGSNGSIIDATTTNTNTTTNSTNPTNPTNTVVDTVVDTGLMLFNNEEFGSVRVKMIDNEPWFVGKDVAVAFKVLVLIINLKRLLLMNLDFIA